jgi:hypothetical protein
VQEVLPCELLHHYQIAVQHPGVSGFEVLEMLMVRDRLKEQVASLTLEQKAQLAMADQTLFAHLSDFYKELARITSLEYGGILMYWLTCLKLASIRSSRR